MATTDIATLKSQVHGGLSGTDFALELSTLGSPALTALAGDIRHPPET